MNSEGITLPWPPREGTWGVCSGIILPSVDCMICKGNGGGESMVQRLTRR